MAMKIKIILLFLLIISFDSYSQCSMCRAVIESQERSEMAEGINEGIKYLAIIPYILVAFVGWRIYRVLKSN